MNSVCNNVLMEHYRSSSRDNPIEDEDSANVPDPSLDVISILSHKEMEVTSSSGSGGIVGAGPAPVAGGIPRRTDKDAVCQDFGVDRDYLRVLLHRAKQAFKAVYLKNMPTDIRDTAAD